MAKFYVWGTDPAQSELLRRGEPTDAAEAAALAAGHTFCGNDEDLHRLQEAENYAARCAAARGHI